jgi:hypothetical protein
MKEVQQNQLLICSTPNGGCRPGWFLTEMPPNLQLFIVLIDL